MKTKSILFLALAAIGGALLWSSVFFVDEREKAIVFKFGEIVKSDIAPGLHFKVPFINNVQYFDSRVQTMDADPELYLTGEKKNLVVDSFVKWRIRDVHQYYTRLQGRQANARSRLSQRVNDSLRKEFGQRSVQEVISGDRTEIMDLVRLAMDEDAASLGIEIIDVRLKRVDLDPAISERVYDRMNAERERVAKELRAQGEEEAEKIRAEADRRRQIMLANAERDGQRLRGEGDASATEIYARAYRRDREFYNLYRSLNAYKQAFNSPDNLMVIDPTSDFFRYFKQSQAGSGN
ncbi:MAG: protease modulator HflC [Gammaproteobacteria bacterium]|nr:protease modulator HflC [Gammaproteobacteria bacterium]MDA8006800.1 protease modulator HflC [Gammaproteobacteria bacterium]